MPQSAQSPTAPHLTCSICRVIPDRCRSFDKGGETVENTIPPAVNRLEVVGAPFYQQEFTHSNRCLLRCPECGTFYEWDFEYEYLAGGSEDDLTITRLDLEDGALEADRVEDAVAAARARFAAEAPSRVRTVMHSADPEAVRQAAGWLFMAQSDGNDLTPYLPDLLAAWQRTESGGDTTGSLSLSLFIHGSRSRENLASLRAAIEAAGMAHQPGVAGVLRTCESASANADEGPAQRQRAYPA